MMNFEVAIKYISDSVRLRLTLSIILRLALRQ